MYNFLMANAEHNSIKHSVYCVHVIISTHDLWFINKSGNIALKHTIFTCISGIAHGVRVNNRPKNFSRKKIRLHRSDLVHSEWLWLPKCTHFYENINWNKYLFSGTNSMFIYMNL